MSSAKKDFSYTFAANIILLLIGIGTQSSLAWFLGPQDRGSYAVCLTFATLLEIIFIFGCDIAIVYFVSSKKFTLSEGLVYTFIYGGTGALLAIACGMTLMLFPLEFFTKAERFAFYLALSSIPLMVFSTTLRNLFTAVSSFKCFAVVTVGHSASLFLMTLIFVPLMKLNVRGALYALIGAHVANIMVCLGWFILKYEIQLIKPSISRLREMFSYGVRYHIGKISNEANLQMGTMLLAFFATKEEVGLFAVASQLAARSMFLPNTLITVLMPKVAGDERGKKELVARCFRLCFLASALFLLFLGLFAKPIMTILFSKEFAEAAILFQILIVGVIARASSKVFVPYLLGTNRPGVVSTAVGSGTVLNFALLWFLLPVLGITAASYSMVASYLLSSFIMVTGFLRFSGDSIFSLLRYSASDFAAIFSVLHKLKSKYLTWQTNKT